MVSVDNIEAFDESDPPSLRADPTPSPFRVLHLLGTQSPPKLGSTRRHRAWGRKGRGGTMLAWILSTRNPTGPRHRLQEGVPLRHPFGFQIRVGAVSNRAPRRGGGVRLCLELGGGRAIRQINPLNCAHLY
ncbi:hypothetical protein NL676_036487 [Syzygium grande]|nr:hypothetical protein NL676_036487 [Syzygium grande]